MCWWCRPPPIDDYTDYNYLLVVGYLDPHLNSFFNMTTCLIMRYNKPGCYYFVSIREKVEHQVRITWDEDINK